MFKFHRLFNCLITIGTHERYGLYFLSLSIYNSKENKKKSTRKMTIVLKKINYYFSYIKVEKLSRVGDTLFGLFDWGCCNFPPFSMVNHFAARELKKNWEIFFNQNEVMRGSSRGVIPIWEKNYLVIDFAEFLWAYERFSLLKILFVYFFFIRALVFDIIYKLFFFF